MSLSWMRISCVYYLCQTAPETVLVITAEEEPMIARNKECVMVNAYKRAVA